MLSTVAQIEATVEACRPLLAGRHPAVQGAILADLLAIWLTGYPEPMREEMLASHIGHVRELIPPNAALIREDAR